MSNNDLILFVMHRDAILKASFRRLIGSHFMNCFCFPAFGMKVINPNLVCSVKCSSSFELLVVLVIKDPMLFHDFDFCSPDLLIEIYGCGMCD